MTNNKKPYLVTAAIICIGTGIVLGTGMFRLSTDGYTQNPLDLFFLISTSILFWYSLAFLFNYLINILLWEKFIKIPIGVSTYQWIKDFTASLSYSVATGIILVDAFGIKLNLLWIAALTAIQLIQTSVRPQLTTIFTGKSTSRINPFNTGDWIKVINESGHELITGQVCNISRGSVFIKTENSNLVSLTSDLISKFLIKNYKGGGDASRFQITCNFDFHIPQKRIKRIFSAAAYQTMYEMNLPLINEPEVIIDTINDNKINYILSYWIKPWIDVSPVSIKNKIYSTFITNLNYAGINSIIEVPSFNGHSSMLNYDLNTLEIKKEILKKIGLFEHLNIEEIDLIASEMKLKEFNHNDSIIQESECGQSMFVVVEGLLNVYKKNSDGYEIQVGLLKPGDFFGEMSLFTGENRSATVKAVCNSVVYEITKEVIAPIIERRSVLAEIFAKIITQRNEINIKKIKDSEIKHKSAIDWVVEKIKTFFHIKN